MNDAGILELPCRGTFTDVLARLEAFLAEHQLRVFTRVDQAAAAREVGLELPPMVLILFGNPAAGTPLLARHPRLALDLPLRVVIEERTPGEVTLLTNTPEFFQRRFELPAAPFGPVVAGLRAVAMGA